jgi:hypothetical protein
LRENQGPIFPHLEILATIPKIEKCKNEKFFERKKVWKSSVKAFIFKNTICIEVKKVAIKTKAQFFHIWKFFAWNCLANNCPASFLDH